MKFDLIVVGSGPAGQKAAVQGAKAGKKVALIERDRVLGGACVHRGTIPSKTLRENALRVKNMRKTAAMANYTLAEDTEMITLITRLDEVLSAHDTYMQRQISRNQIEWFHGRAKFISETEIAVSNVRGETLQLRGTNIIVACGSYPRTPDNVPVDHEHIFDSDSILSTLYLPKSLVVLGGGVIASEYASIFQTLGVQVTMIDFYPRPLGFLDADLTDTFVHSFESAGGTWVGEAKVETVHWDGITDVVTTCSDGRQFRSEKLLCAAGRVANVKDLEIENAGLTLNDRGLISVNGDLQTSVPNIYAAGDVIGPPSLASTSMEQGRRATCNALGKDVGGMSGLIPTGIYAIPELSAVGLSQQEAEKQYGGVIVGKANFDEIARGQISGSQDGMLKIICDGDGCKILGVSIVGEGATELIHIGQMAMLANFDVDVFIESSFNFPTLAESYRVAALAVVGQRAVLSRPLPEPSSEFPLSCVGK